MNGPSTPCIISLGARTSLGENPLSSAAAVRGAISALAEHPFMVDKCGEPMFVARDPFLAADLFGAGRLIALATAALEQISLPRTTGHIPCFVGCPEPRPGHPPIYNDEIGQKLSLALSTRTSSQVSAPISYGHTGGLFALQAAITELQIGECEFSIAGGVESYLQPETLEWLDEHGKLMSEDNRSGFAPGEGAGFCLLASENTALRRQMPILCRIIGVGTSWEENGINSEGVCVGVGMSTAISQACRSLAVPAERIGFTYCDLNGERYRSEEFTLAAMRTQKLFLEVTDNLTPADCWGDVGAASGPLFAALAIASAQRNYAKGPRVLLWTSSESGQRAAALLGLTLRTEEG